MEEIELALLDVEEPERPKDGDCERWAPTVTEALADWDARTVYVIGWVGETLVFMHRATLVGEPEHGVVVDFTAGQFKLREPLPRRWITDTGDYCARLAEATGVVRVTLSLPPR